MIAKWQALSCVISVLSLSLHPSVYAHVLYIICIIRQHVLYILQYLCIRWASFSLFHKRSRLRLAIWFPHGHSAGGHWIQDLNLCPQSWLRRPRHETSLEAKSMSALREETFPWNITLFSRALPPNSVKTANSGLPFLMIIQFSMWTVALKSFSYKIVKITFST